MEDAPTKERLLDAAELLFAEEGIHATSVRAIAAAAGQANVSAVIYHFGSKEGLIRATLARRLVPLIQERLRLLDTLQATARGDTLAVEAILHAYFAPAMELFRRHPQSLRFTGRMVSEPDPELHQLYTSFFQGMTHRFLAALREALPDLPEAELVWRWHFVLGVGVHLWTNYRDLEALSRGCCSLADEAAVVDRLVSFCAAGLRSVREKG